MRKWVRRGGGRVVSAGDGYRAWWCAERPAVCRNGTHRLVLGAGGGVRRLRRVALGGEHLAQRGELAVNLRVEALLLQLDALQAAALF